MSVSDPIADMLTRIRNATRNKFKSVDVLLSHVNLDIAKVLKSEGYISGFDVKKNDNKVRNVLRIYLRYVNGKDQIIQGLERVSKPSRRVYVKSKEIPQVLNGYGVAILSTPKGIVPDKKARSLNTGGEILCNVW